MRHYSGLILTTMLALSLTVATACARPNTAAPDPAGPKAAPPAEQGSTPPVTRAEVTKLLVDAGQWPIYPNGLPPWESPKAFRSPLTPDIRPDHWLFQQGYLYTPVAGALLGNERSFHPDEPAHRIDLLLGALALLKPFFNPPEPTVTLPFDAELSVAQRRFVHAGLELGLVTTYPDGTFRPNEPVTRAEAMEVVQRTIDRMGAGDEPNLKLVVDGQPVPGAVLAVREGVLYAPAQALFSTANDTQPHDFPESFTLRAQNERYLALEDSLKIDAGQPRALLEAHGRTVTEMQLPGSPYIRFGKLMVPVVPVGGQGSIPYGTAHHDPATATLTITHGADWPVSQLPTRPEQLHLHLPVGHVVGPGFRAGLRIPLLKDAQENLIHDKQMPPVTYTFDPSTPLRFPGGATSFTISGSAGDAELPEPVLLPNATAGIYTMRITVTGYAPLDQEVQVIVE